MSEMHLSNDLPQSILRMRIDVLRWPGYDEVFNLARAIMYDVNESGILPDHLDADLDFLGRGSLIIQLFIEHWQEAVSLVGTAATLATLWKGGKGSAPPLIQKTMHQHFGNNFYITVSGQADPEVITRAVLDAALPPIANAPLPSQPSASTLLGVRKAAQYGDLEFPKALGNFLVHDDDWIFVIAGGTVVSIDGFPDYIRPRDDKPVLANLTAVKLSNGEYSRTNFTVSAWQEISLPPPRNGQPVAVFEGTFGGMKNGELVFHAGPAGDIIVRNLSNIDPSDKRYALVGWHDPYDAEDAPRVLYAYDVHLLDG